MSHTVDKYIIIKLKKGNLEAFISIYNMFSTRIFHFCNKLLPAKTDAEDIVQKTFIALWKQRTQLDETKDILKYLYSIARNYTYQYFRKCFADKNLLMDIGERIESPKNKTEEDIDFNESYAIIFSIIEKLPQKRKEIFKLSRFEGLTYREIANKLGISENTVDTQMRKSLQFLKANYQQYFSE